MVDADSKEYFGTPSGQLVMVKADPERVTIQLFAADTMLELGRNEYKDFPDDTSVQKVLQVGKRIFYMYAVYDDSLRQETVFAREVDTTAGTLLEARELFRTQGEVVSGGFGSADRRKLGFYTSFDQSKVLVSYRRKPAKKDDSVNKDLLGFFVFDGGLSKIWGGEVAMPYTEEAMNNLAWTVSRDGTVYLLAHINEADTIELLAIDKAMAVTVHPLKVDGSLFFQRMTLVEDVDGSLVCAGFYANGLEWKVNWVGGGGVSVNTNGIYSFKLNGAGKVLETHDHPFPIELINAYQTDRLQAKNESREAEGKAGIGDLTMMAVVEQADGSTVLVGEQVYTRREYNVMQNSVVTTYYYTSMVVTKVSAKGEVVWMKKLPKQQVGERGRGGMGAKYVAGDGAHYLLFLDNPKNENLSLNAVPEKHVDGRGGWLTAYRVDDATGEIQRFTILDPSDIDGITAYQFTVERIFEAKDNVFMLEVYIKGKKDMMVRMELQP